MKNVQNLCLLGLLLIVAVMAAPIVCAQEDSGQGPNNMDSAGEENSSTETMLPRIRDERFWISGQANFIFQAHPPFDAKYTGTNSLQPNYEKATSRVVTLFTGVQLNNSTELLFDVEEAGGAGLSQALGLAGFSNLDVVRNPTLSKEPYIARVMVHKVFRLSKDSIENERNPLSTFGTLPARRLEVRAGKFGTVDFFDSNSVGSDSHMQFMNWAVDQNGAYDFAADTRGYTWGVVTEYQDRAWAFRFAEALMPKVANGIDLVWDLRKAHSENFEYELRKGFLPRKPGVVRLLSYVNHANMGIYRDAVARYEAGLDPVPEITDHAWHTTAKYGFGVNLEQAVTRDLTAFARWGWNNGKTESFAYTEIDSTVAVGAAESGRRWNRNHDRAGVAFVSNGISKDHQNYLADGGVGFIIGDGGLNYGRENIFETYYTAHLWRGIYVAPALQHVNNPAYNRDRGPVLIGSLRLHVEF